VRWVELVREYFPDASDEQAEYILWRETGFPCFWRLGEDGATPEACYRKQLQEFKDSIIWKLSKEVKDGDNSNRNKS